MATIRYLGDEPRQVSLLPSGTLRRLEPDEVFQVPDVHAKSYTSQPRLFRREDEPVRKPAKAPAKTKETD